jgi:formylmethanofuran dehydrogenase subunit C
VSALCLTLREPPAQRLDLSALLPARLAALSPAAIERLPVHTTRRALLLGDVFRLRPGDADEVVIEGGSARFDGVGAGMSGGVLRVIGAVGQRAGCGMGGGRVLIEGDAGPVAAAGSNGGWSSAADRVTAGPGGWPTVRPRGQTVRSPAP